MLALLCCLTVAIAVKFDKLETKYCTFGNTFPCKFKNYSALSAGIP